MKQNKGFTLIELLAVIVILAIIALIAVPTILRVMEKSREGAAKASALSYIEAVDLYNGTAELNDKLTLKANERYSLIEATVVDGIGYLPINDLVGIKGEKPTGLDDYIILSDTYKVIEGQMTFGNYVVIISNGDITVIKNGKKVQPTDMTLNIEEETTMERGSTTQIKVTFEPVDTTNQKVTYEIKPEGIVTVDENGNVKTVGYGKATITVTSKEDSSIKKSIEIEVIRPENVKSITLEKEDKDLYVGGTIQLTAKLEPVDAISNAVTWTSSDESVATVDSSGLVMGVSTGTVTIKGTTTNGIEATLELEVKPVLAESITIAGEDTAFVGIESEYKAIVKPDNTTDKTVTWSVSDNTVASIDSNGKLKGIKTGNVTIIAKTSNGIETTKDIEIQNAPLCKRATSLHTQTCTQNNSSVYCDAYGYSGKIMSYGNLGKKGTLTSGDAFDCDINGDGKFDKDTERFYYVTDMDSNGDAVNETAVLIYYSNTAPNSEGNIIPVSNHDSSVYVQYESTNISQNGPGEAVKYLPTTNDWTNISLVNPIRDIVSDAGVVRKSNFSYEGKAARLITYYEIQSACGSENVDNSGIVENCTYLLENTEYSTNTYLQGYWLETTYSGYSASVWEISAQLGVSNVFATSNNYRGVRPVIEVLKDDIEI